MMPRFLDSVAGLLIKKLMKDRCPSPRLPLPLRKWPRPFGLPALPGDEPRAALVARVNPQPIERHAQPVADADEKIDVGEAPQPPRDRPLELDPAEIDHRPPLADRRQIALVPVAERRGRGRAAKPGADDVRDIDPLLLGRGRDAGNRPPVLPEDNGRIADGENLRMPRDGQVGLDLEPPRLVRGSAEPECG